MPDSAENPPNAFEDWSPDLQKARVNEQILLDIILGELALGARPDRAALHGPSAANAGPEDIAALRSAFDGAEEAIRARDVRALVAMDQRFRAAPARAGRNATLARIIIPLHHKAVRFWIFSMAGDTEEERIAEIQRHRDLTERIAAGDIDGARDAVAAVLGVFSDNLKRMVTGGRFSGGLAFRGGRRV